MKRIEILGKGISKSYNGIDYVFQNLSFEICNGDVFGVFGPNGSGKSTLLKIIARILLPTEGKITTVNDGNEIPFEKQRLLQGLVAPYLVLFEEFNPIEHIKISANILGKDFNAEKANELIDKFGLEDAVAKHIKEFSSGMKQRMKFILALYFEPEILLLDEPFTNLDEKGIQFVEECIKEFQSQGKIVVIATNDKREASLCNKYIRIGKSTANEPDFHPSV
ncbi:ABC transporter ATP-binding protein [Bacteroidetes/Chlorobi group bacterium Naka2016]|jgi:heme exporter protein A|nr:MAG: ABC transporter ATP-binding protein [Bacteroidetes/Chlorobi group bacterium Naka2016]